MFVYWRTKFSIVIQHFAFRCGHQTRCRCIPSPGGRGAGVRGYGLSGEAVAPHALGGACPWACRRQGPGAEKALPERGGARPRLSPHPAPPDGGDSASPARREAEGEAATANPSPGGRGAGVRGYGLSGEAVSAHALGGACPWACRRQGPGAEKAPVRERRGAAPAFPSPGAA